MCKCFLCVVPALGLGVALRPERGGVPIGAGAGFKCSGWKRRMRWSACECDQKFTHSRRLEPLEPLEPLGQ
eukprot:8192753-Alexandrium_andersonii.AAC.1